LAVGLHLSRRQRQILNAISPQLVQELDFSFQA
jgi:hypothetical protein